MTDVDLVRRADREGEGFRRVGGIFPNGPCPRHCGACRGAALWQALNALRGLELVR